MPVKRSNRLWTMTLDRYIRAGLPECVVRTISGPPPETIHDRIEIHTQSRTEIKIPDLAGNRNKATEFILSRHMKKRGKCYYCCCCFCYVTTDMHYCYGKRPSPSLDGYMVDGYMKTGDECDSNFLIFVLRLREKPAKKTLPGKLTRPGIEPGPAA